MTTKFALCFKSSDGQYHVLSVHKTEKAAYTRMWKGGALRPRPNTRFIIEVTGKIQRDAVLPADRIVTMIDHN